MKINIADIHALEAALAASNGLAPTHTVTAHQIPALADRFTAALADTLPRDA